MKALTLYPEHAAMFVAGIRTIETRSKPTRYRGPLALHAGVRDPDCAAARRSPRSQAALDSIPDGRPLVLGAIVATCQLVDVVPIVAGHLSEQSHVSLGAGGWGRLGTRLYLDTYTPSRGITTKPIESQLPYGDFTPGRFAWLLEDVKPTTERCPVCWPCDEDLGDRICGSITFDSWAEDASVRQCAECAHVCAHPPCSVCEGKGTCDPIPARGRQGLWNWTP